MTGTPKVLLEDNHNLVLWKPGGLPSQAPGDFPSLESWARNYLKEKYSKVGRPYLGIPHRLDRPVTGAHYLAKSSKAAARVAEQFRLRQVYKGYLALVQAPLPEDLSPWFCWIDWVRKIPDQAKGECCSPKDDGARPALLEARLLGNHGDLALISILLQTGRMHQIRIQAARRGIPIAGDTLYSGTTPWPSADKNQNNSIALHSWRFGFYHPIQYSQVFVEAPLPDSWPGWVLPLLSECPVPVLPARSSRQ